MIVRVWEEDVAPRVMTVNRTLRRWSLRLRRGFLTIVALAIALLGAQLWRSTSVYGAYAVAMLTLAEVNLAIGYPGNSGLEGVLENGDTAFVAIADMIGYPSPRVSIA